MRCAGSNASSLVGSVAPISHRARIRELSPLFTRRVVIRALGIIAAFIDPVWPRETSPLSGLLFLARGFCIAQ